MIALQQTLNPQANAPEKTRSSSSNPLLSAMKRQAADGKPSETTDFATLVQGKAKKSAMLNGTSTKNADGKLELGVGETGKEAGKTSGAKLATELGSNETKLAETPVPPIKPGASTQEVAELKSEFTSQLKDVEKAITALVSGEDTDTKAGRALIDKLSKLSKNIAEALTKLKQTIETASSETGTEIDPNKVLEQLGDIVAKLTQHFDEQHDTNFSAVMASRAQNLLENLQAKAGKESDTKSAQSSGLRSIGEVFQQVKSLLEPPRENMIRARAFAEGRKFDLAVMRASAATSGDKSTSTVLPGVDMTNAGEGAKFEKLLGDLTQNLGSRPQMVARPVDPLAPLTMPMNVSGDTSLTKDEIDTAMRAMSASKPGDVSPDQSARFSSLVTKQIRSMTLTGDRTRIQLAPQGLGDVEVDVHTDPSGKVRAVVRADNPLVLDTLKNEKDQLANLLEEKGAELGENDLEFEDFGDRGNGNQDGDGDDAEDGLLEADADDSSPESNPTWSPDGSVNILT